MASISAPKPSSFPTSIPRLSYDVFLSFRGEDTRKNFTGHLFKALVANGINTFKDDGELQTGEVIADAVIQAIEESKVFFVIFSRNYAYSKWCLNELVKIIECMKAKQRRVVPVFYDVDPSQVRSQSGRYGKAFAYHQKDASQEKKEIQKWRIALTEASNLAGYDLQNYQYESELIENIIDDILEMNPQLLHVRNNIVGMNLHLEKLKSLIKVESNDVRMVGIYGIGGIGKTTISKAIYNEISTKFEGVSFLEDVRGKSKDDSGLVQLQQQLINCILKRKYPTISNSHEGIHVIKKRLQTKRVLVILDDVDNLKQLEHLVGKRDWFDLGSRIIITSRDRHLLDVHGVDALYEVKELNQKEAIQLFSQHAFREDLAKEPYVELSKRVVDYTKGHPLALKVLGSLLFRKTVPEWESELCKLKKKPNMDVQNVLRISFDGLDDLEKELFLDIACFFKGQNEHFVTRILDSCSFNATIGIKVLQDKCLITSFHGVIRMHDLLQEMGREIVRQDNPRHPENWSRLWESDDVYCVLQKEMGTKAIEGIFLDMATSRVIQFTNEGFKMMKNLRLFKVYQSSHHNGSIKRDYKVLIPHNFEFPSYELRYLYWDGYPLKFLPSHFDGENLVKLNLRSSSIKQIWKGNKCFPALKVVDLSHSKKLIKVSNFSSMKNLETLILQGCTSLRCVDQSIGVLKKLTLLNFKGCQRLKSLPSSVECLESLETLNLSSCTKLEIFPEIKRNMESLLWLELGGTAIKELPSSIDHFTALRRLDLPECKNFKSLPSSICRLKCLVNLNLNGCSNLEAFPEITENMKSLQYLFLCETAIKELPLSIENLVDLRFLVLDNCKNLATLPSSIYYLRSLMTLRLANCSRLHKHSEKWNLECLGTNGPQWASLIDLSLKGTNIRSIPVSITQLGHLRYLDVSHCKMLEEIQWLPSSLEYLDASDCIGIKILELSETQNSDDNGSTLQDTNGCKMLEEIQRLPSSQEYLDARDCTGIKILELSDTQGGMKCLRFLDLSKTAIESLPSSIYHLDALRVLLMGEFKNLRSIPSSISRLKCLKEIVLRGCTNLESFQYSRSCELQYCLKYLDLSGCNLVEESILSDIWCMSSLKGLNLSRNNISSIPAGINQLRNLKWLDISHCKMLREIPELPSSLIEIDAHDCTSKEDLSRLLWSCHLNWLKATTQDLKCWKFCTVIPGSSSGIPEWTMYPGSEITIELPMNWYKDGDFLGFAFSCLCGPGKKSDTGIFQNLLECTCELSLNVVGFGFSDDCQCGFCCECYTFNDVEDQLFVWWYPKTAIPKEHHQNKLRHFNASFKDGPMHARRYKVDIKKCGVNLIFAGDHQHNHVGMFLDHLQNSDDNGSTLQDTN